MGLESAEVLPIREENRRARGRSNHLRYQEKEASVNTKCSFQSYRCQISSSKALQRFILKEDIMSKNILIHKIRLQHPILVVISF